MDLAVLDMAGTTIDDGNVVYQVLRAVVEAEGAVVDHAQFLGWTGTEKRWAIENLLRIGGVEADDALIDRTWARFRADLAAAYVSRPPRPLSGVPEALEQLRARGIKVVLTTGFDEETADALLRGIGWTTGAGDPGATVDGMVCATQVRAGRPAPYMIHHAMEAVGSIDVHEVAAAGDTPADVLAAHHAGVRAIGVLSGASRQADFAALPVDLVVESVAALPEHPLFTP